MQRTRGRRGRAAGAARASPGSGSSATQDNRDGVRDKFGSPPPPRRQRAEGNLDTRVAQDAAAAAAAAMGAKAVADSGRNSWRTTVGFCVVVGARVTRVTRQDDNEANWRGSGTSWQPRNTTRERQRRRCAARRATAAGERAGNRRAGGGAECGKSRGGGSAGLGFPIRGGFSMGRSGGWRDREGGAESGWERRRAAGNGGERLRTAGLQRRVHAGAPRRRRDGWRRGRHWCAAEEARGLVEGYTMVRRGRGGGLVEGYTLVSRGGGAMAGVWSTNDVCCTRVV